MIKKKILINTYYFYPDVTPRAFRAFELVKEFARQGYEVTVLLPKSDYNYRDICQKYNFSVDFVEYNKLKKHIDSSNASREPTFLKKMLRKLLKRPLYCFFPSGLSLKFYFYSVYKSLKKEQQNYDIFLSISNPYDTHIGAAMAFGVNKKLSSSIKIADYGDPLYKNPILPKCRLYFWIDRFIALRFDYITIPTEKAMSVYTIFKSEDRIKIIPQGLNFSSFKKADYKKNLIPSFGYAGVFYEDIRNPTVLLESLYKIHQKNVDFRFLIYTKTDDPYNMKLLNKYITLLGDKLIIHNIIPREKVIYELSRMDFLINLENLSESQIPSKLIDYGLAKRPIYSFNQLSFSEEEFMKFFNSDYSQSTVVELEQFDIKNVANQFLQCSETLE